MKWEMPSRHRPTQCVADVRRLSRSLSLFLSSPRNQLQHEFFTPRSIFTATRDAIRGGTWQRYHGLKKYLGEQGSFLSLLAMRGTRYVVPATLLSQ